MRISGYDVVGVFMQNWDQVDEKGECIGEQDRNDAEYICKQLQIPLRQTKFVKEYWNDVFRLGVSNLIFSS